MVTLCRFLAIDVGCIQQWRLHIYNGPKTIRNGHEKGTAIDDECNPRAQVDTMDTVVMCVSLG